MPDYKQMYLHLAGKVADAVDLLIQAQRDCEEMLLPDADGEPESNLILLDPPQRKKQ